jgi:cytochrome P450
MLYSHKNVTFKWSAPDEPGGGYAPQFTKRGEMAIAALEPYYDPYDFEIDADPYPVWKRLRDEAPLYYNEKYDFFAVSRYDDVESCLVDWQTYSSAKGSVLEIIKAGVQMPPACSSSRTRRTTTCTGGCISRVFTPRRLAAIEPQVRAFAARSWSRSRRQRAASTSSGTWAPRYRCGPSGCSSECPRRTSRTSETTSTRASGWSTASCPRSPERADRLATDYAEYIDWRGAPSDDLMTELLTAEFTDVDGTVRTLTRDEVLGYIGLLAGAGNETTTRLIGWAAKLLAEHPDQRKALVDDPALIPNAIEECLRYEAPSPVQSRYVTRDVEHHGRRSAGSIMVLLNGSANRDEREFPDPDRFDIHRKVQRHLSLGYGIHFCLGAHLARLEARVALEEVLKRFPEWEIDMDNAVQARTSTVRGWEKLPVFTP